MTSSVLLLCLLELLNKFTVELLLVLDKRTGVLELLLVLDRTGVLELLLAPSDKERPIVRSLSRGVDSLSPSMRLLISLGLVTVTSD